MTMALQTPGHMKIVRFPRQRHLVHPAVTGFAADAFSDVNAVIEIHEVGNAVDAVPSERTVLAQAGTDRLQHIAGRPDLLVAVHARRCRRNTGERASFNFRMAISAIDAEPSNMVLGWSSGIRSAVT